MFCFTRTLALLLLSAFISPAVAAESDIAPVGTHRGGNEKWGYANSRGEIVIPATFAYASEFTPNGLARVSVGQKSGYIDKTGKFVIPAKYDHAEDFTPNGLARVSEDRKFGYINAAGEVVIALQFQGADSFGPNGLAAAMQGWRMGYIDEKGTFVIPPVYFFAAKFSAVGLARVELDNGKRAYIDRTGKKAFEDEFDDAGDFSEQGEALVRKNGKAFIIDRNGKFVREFHQEANPVADQIFRPAANGLSLARKEKLWGFLDASKNWVIPPQYIWAKGFNSVGLAPVVKDKKAFYINAKGEYVLEVD
ncbi:MAG TPA: WG repeat-containing protein [Noviherbaspirillum sp.]|nr:WG repeat-containing protein [Noviherbaspirillum sp.]